MATVAESWLNQLLDGSPLDGVEIEGYLSQLRLGVNDIINAQVNDNAGIEGSKLADNSIAGSKLLDNSISLAKMLDNSVDTPELVSLAVTQAKLELFTGSGTGVGLANMDDLAISEAKVLWNDPLGVQGIHVGDARLRAVRGSEEWSVSGAKEATGSLTFDPDSFDADLTWLPFTTIPIILTGIHMDSASDVDIRAPQIHTITTAGFSWVVGFDVSSTESGDLMWLALGLV